MLKHLSFKDSSLKVDVASCGIGDWHIGQAPDPRIQEAAKCRGIVLTSHARQFQHSFFDEFDYILAVDQEVLKHLYQQAKNPEHKGKVCLVTAFSSTYENQGIPDPYYQPDGAFEVVLDMLEDSCQGLLRHIRNESKK